MEEIGQRMVWHYVPFTDIALPLGGINVLTVFNSLLCMGILLALLWWATRRREWIPSRAQAAVEALVGTFNELLESALGEEHRSLTRRTMPLIMSAFVFILLCNAIVFIPLPYIEEPTNDLNCTMAMAILMLTYVTISGVQTRGAGGYLEELCGPMWHQPGVHGMAALPGRLSALFFFPLKVVEELSRVVSLSCRLFGNIMGASIIIIVLSTLGYYVGLPLILDVFLLVFEAALQAFVFVTLTIVYLSAAVSSE